MKKYLIISAFLLLQFMATAAQTSSLHSDEDSLARARAFDYFYMQALAMANSEDYASVADLYRHCLSINPNSAVVKFELATICSALGRKDEALKMMQEAVAAQPDNFWYRNSLAMRYREMGNTDGAIECYSYMAENFPEESSSYIALSDVYAEKNDFENAYNALSEYEKKEGPSYEITYRKVSQLIRLARTDDAIAEIKNLIKETPEDIQAKILLVEMYAAFDRHDEAMQLYNDMLRQDSTNVNLLMSIADYYSSLGTEDGHSTAHLYMDKLFRNETLEPEIRGELLTSHLVNIAETKGEEAAIGYFEDLIKFPYEQAQVGELLISYLKYLEYPNEKIAPVLRHILVYVPDNVSAHYELVKILAAKENYIPLIEQCNNALRYHPDEAAFYYYKAASQYNMGIMQAAAETFKHGAEMCKDYADAELISIMFGNAGDVYHSLGEEQLSMELYDSALVYNEANVEVLNNYAYHLAESGENLAKALEMSSVCVESDPSNVTYIDTHAWVLFKMKRYEEAKAYVEWMLSLEEEIDSAVLYEHAGDIYAKSGNIDEAVNCWKIALGIVGEDKMLTEKIKKRKYIDE